MFDDLVKGFSWFRGLGFRGLWFGYRGLGLGFSFTEGSFGTDPTLRETSMDHPYNVGAIIIGIGFGGYIKL